MAHDGGPDWAALYRSYAPALQRLVATLAPASEVEDAVQETFIRLHQGWHRFDRSMPLWPLLATMARRVCADRWRSRKREVVYLAPELPSAEGSFVDSLQDDEISRALTVALQGLSPRDRRVLLRCLFDGATRAEVADEEGLTTPALKMALSRARHRFRAAYLAAAQEGVFGGWAILARARAWFHRRLFGWRGPAAEAVRFCLSITAVMAAAAVTVSALDRAVPVRAGAASAARASSSSAPHLAVSLPEERYPSRADADPPLSPRRPLQPGHDEGNVGAPLVTLQRADHVLGVGPEKTTLAVYIEWSDPFGNGHGYTAAEVDCSHEERRVLAGATCPMLRSLPVTRPSPE